MHPVLSVLDAMGCREENLRLLVWEFPRIFGRDYRRQIRKFQYLGLYGLSLPAAGPAVREASRLGKA